MFRSSKYAGHFSPQAEIFLQGEIVYRTFYNKAMAEVYKPMSKQLDSVTHTMSGSDAYWDAWHFSPDAALSSPSYRSSLLTYFNSKVEKEIGRPVNDREREIFFYRTYGCANRELSDHPLTREYMEAFFLYHMLSFVQSKDSVAVLAKQFYKEFPQSVYSSIIEKRLSVKKNVSEQSPEIAALDTNNRLVSLKEFKGKIIYVDIWASWCGPCLQEFPYSKVLAEKLKDKIVFVYLNIDDTEQAWRSVIKAKQLKGLHLRADSKMSREIRNMLDISAIPRYVLIDKNGILLSADAKRPREVEPDILHFLNR
jgi:thiol-disulfide isomerase/thioredoxin